MTTMNTNSIEIAALEIAVKHLEDRIQELRGNRTEHSSSFSAPRKPGRPPAPSGRRTMSAESRKRIAEAQRKRWAQQHQNEQRAQGAQADIAPEPEIQAEEVPAEPPPKAKPGKKKGTKRKGAGA